MNFDVDVVTFASVITGLTIWLAALARLDVRTRAVPAWATAGPVVLAGLLRIFVAPPDGAVWPGGLAVAGALAMVLASDTRWAIWPAGMAAFCAGLAGPESRVLVASWICSLILTLIGVWGAGDGKVCATLLALFPDARLALALGGAVELGCILAVIRRHGWATPLALGSVLHDVRRLRFPAHTGARGYHPLLPWLALGTWGYLALRGAGVW